MQTEKSTKKNIDSSIRKKRIALKIMTLILKQQIHLFSVLCTKEYQAKTI